jgi:hypothetical protein
MVEVKMMIPTATIDAILQKEDVEGLLNLGAPKDEYSREAAEIHAALEAIDENDVTSDGVAAVVMNVWERSFGPFSPDDLQKRSPVLQQVVQYILDSRISLG